MLLSRVLSQNFGGVQVEPIGNYTGMHGTNYVYQKKMGSLGFLMIDEFNSALLAKRLWRLIQKLKTLFARVMKARYYRNFSPIWRIISIILYHTDGKA